MFWRRTRLELALLFVVGSGTAVGEGERAYWCPQPTLRESLRGLLKSTSRSLRVFHGTGRDRVGLNGIEVVASDDPRARNFLAQKLARFWSDDQPHQEGTLVSGLYAATDPVLARGFGAPGDEWVLLVIELAPATRLLDLRIPRGESARFELTPSQQYELQRAGCVARFPLTLFTSPQPGCLPIARNLIREFEVEALVVPLPRAPLLGCGDRPEGELLLVAPRLLAKAELLLLESGPPTDRRGRAARALVDGIFARARAAGSNQIAPWSGRASDDPPADLDAWMQQNIMGCSGAVEDLEPRAFCP